MDALLAGGHSNTEGFDGSAHRFLGRLRTARVYTCWAHDPASPDKGPRRRPLTYLPTCLLPPPSAPSRIPFAPALSALFAIRARLLSARVPLSSSVRLTCLLLPPPPTTTPRLFPFRHNTPRPSLCRASARPLSQCRPQGECTLNCIISVP